MRDDRNGRIFVRPSGTEPLCELWQKLPTEEVNYYVDTIATVVKDEIGIDLKARKLDEMIKMWYNCIVNCSNGERENES